MPKKLTHDEFVKKSLKKHGDKYDYHQTEYQNSAKKVKIYCNGCKTFFWQKANDHMAGRGCLTCSGSKKLTLTQFVKTCSEKHNNKYDYSLSKYINGDSKLKIICPIHGEFEQLAIVHMNGHGCQKCSKKYSPTKDEFFKLGLQKYNGIYDYSEADYVNYTTPIKIICPTHGEFRQSPNIHITATGCPKCSGKTLKTTSEFITEATIKHNNKYDYSLSKYINSKTKLTIICPTHGEFQQSPNSHLRGQGCSSCSNTKKSSTTEFIETAILYHGNKYDYSEVVYKNSQTKVKIFCKKCNEYFYQIPELHLKTSGCNKCNRKNKRSEFEEAIKSEKYNNFECFIDEYTTQTTPIKILCNSHNHIFYKTPVNFLNNPKCELCVTEQKDSFWKSKLDEMANLGISATKIDRTYISYNCIKHGIVKVKRQNINDGCRFCNKEQRIIKAIHKRFGDLFDCSQVKYVDKLTKIKLICNEHSEPFEILPSKLHNIKCSHCHKPPRKKGFSKYNTEKFIKIIQEIHKDKDYDYSQVKYVNSNTKITIGCKIHGPWTTAAGNILDKCGCPKCGILNRTYVQPISEDIIVERFRKLYGDKYSYNMSDYLGCDSKITITCNIHKSHPFRQRVSSHLGGNGCPHCKTSKGELKVLNYLESTNISFKTQYKFPDCKNIKPLAFDFAVINNNSVIGLIEYNGQQHYQIINWHGSDEKNIAAFENYKLRDNIKYDYCIRKNIPLLILKYTEFNNVETLVNEFLSSLNVL